MKLTAEEREVIVTYNDAEKAWRVYSDSATMRGAILRLARKVGATVERIGEGVEFISPADALRLTAKRRGVGNLGNLRRTLQPPRQEALTGAQTHS